MKTLLLLSFFLSTSLWALERVPLFTGKLYIPSGYDDNDLVEVSVSGQLPDLCHRNPTYELLREGNEFKIFLFAYYVPQPEGCKEVAIPYLETINLGVLPQGEYSVKLLGVRNRVQPKSLKITEAKSPLQDDFLYGNVLGIVESENGRDIELVGTNPVNCLVFKNLESEVQDGMIILRPKFEEAGLCEKKPTPFSIKYRVPHLRNQPRGIMLHVRVMAGRSFNYLYQNRL